MIDVLHLEEYYENSKVDYDEIKLIGQFRLVESGTNTDEEAMERFLTRPNVPTKYIVSALLYKTIGI